MPLFRKRKASQPFPPERAAEVQRYAKEALLLSGRLKRPMTPNDLYMILYVPWELVDHVMAAITDVPTVSLDQLSSDDLARLDNASQSAISASYQADPQHLQEEGLSLGDIAVRSPKDWTLDQIKELFGFIVAVLQLKTLPPRDSWPIDIKDLAHRASTLPPTAQSTYGLVSELGIGVYKARLVKEALG